MVEYGKMTLVTGKTALYNIKTSFNKGWILALYIMLALIIGEILTTYRYHGDCGRLDNCSVP